jgi:hypothetical protein
VTEALILDSEAVNALAQTVPTLGPASIQRWVFQSEAA